MPEGRVIEKSGLSRLVHDRRVPADRENTMITLNRRAFCAAASATVLAGLTSSKAGAAESVTYLFPAPPILPAFGPIQLAKGRGYFEKEGLDVKFEVGRGGVDVAKQVGAGNAPVGGIVADG